MTDVHARRLRTALAGAAALALLAACGGGDAEPSADSVANAAGGAPNVDAATPAAELPPAGSVPIEVDVTVDGRRLTRAGLGDCRYSGNSTLYDAPVDQWTATFDGADPRHARITVFRHKDGSGDEFSAAVGVGDESHQISVMRKGTSQGSGNAKVDAAAGQLEVTGKDQNGKDVVVKLHCGRWDSLDAVGNG